MISIPVRPQDLCTLFYVPGYVSVSYFTVYGNLNRICTLLLRDVCIKLNYVESVHVLFRPTISFYVSVYFILVIFGSLTLILQLKILIYLLFKK